VPFVVGIVAAVVGAVGSVVGAVAGFLGISAATLGVSLAVTVGKSLLGGRKKTEPSRSMLDRLNANIDVRTPRKTVVGRTAFATDIRDEEISGVGDTELNRWIVLASHEVASIDEMWFDDKLAWTASGGPQGEYAGGPPWLISVQPRTVGSAGNALTIRDRVPFGSRRYTGCAYIYIRYVVLPPDESPFGGSIPSRITIRGKGAKFYDPRKDSTVPGGSGSHRADDQSTWEWDDDACRNPALALLFYLLGWRIQNPSTSEWLLAVGKGIPQERINLESFAVAANVCDEPVPTFAGGYEPRYRCDGVWSEGDSTQTVIDMITATMNADLDDMDGQLRLTVFHNDLADDPIDLSDADILNAFEWQPDLPLDQSANIVRGLYTDPSDASLYQPIDYPAVSYDSPDGIDRIDTFNVPMVQSAGQAQRLAAMRIGRDLYGAGTFKADFQATAWRLQKNSIVRLTFAPLGFVNKLFRVAEMDLRTDGVVPLTLREESPSIYDPPPLFPAIDPYDPYPRSPTNVPILSAIAKSLRVVTDRNMVNYDGTGALDPATQDIHFTAYKQRTTAPVTWAVEDAGGNPKTPTSDFLSAATGDTVTMTAAQFDAARGSTYGVIITATLVDDLTALVDKINVIQVMQGQDGADGDDGAAGLSNAVVYLYQRAASAPGAPTGTFTFTFASGALSGGSPGAWTQAIPAADGNPLWVIAATASSSAATDSIAASEFTSPVISSGAGLNTATVRLYQRKSTAPAVPSSTLTYTFMTGELSGTLGSWSQTVSSGANPLYTTQATALSTGSTDTIPSSEWSAPAIIAQNGSNGADGAAGAPASYIAVTKRAFPLPAYMDGTVASFASANGLLTAWTGATDVTSSATLSATSSGCTGTINTAANTPVSGQPKGYYRVTAMSADEATLTLNAVIGGVTYTEVVAITKVKTGPEIVSSLPDANLFNGREVYLTTDQKRYIYKSGAGWDRKFDGADLITNSVGTNSLDAGSVTAAKLAATNVITLSAQIADAIITGAKIGDAQVDTLKIAGNAVSVPIAMNSGITRYGNATLQTVVSGNITLDEPGRVFVSFTATQGFSAGARYWNVQLRVNGTQISGVSGSGVPTDSVCCSGSDALPAGTHLIEVMWYAADGTVQLSNDTTFAQGVMR
jgi:hypothetical protein